MPATSAIDWLVAPMTKLSRTTFISLGHRLIKAHPNSDRGELYASEIVVVAFVVSGGDGAEVLEFVEEALDQIASAIEPLVKGRKVHPVRHQFDIGSRAARGEVLTQRVGIIGAVTQQNVAEAEGAQHVLGAASVMGLAFGDLQKDRQAAGIDKGVDFCRQPATRATHATGSRL